MDEVKRNKRKKFKFNKEWQKIKDILEKRQTRYKES